MTGRKKTRYLDDIFAGIFYIIFGLGGLFTVIYQEQEFFRGLHKWVYLSLAILSLLLVIICVLCVFFRKLFLEGLLLNFLISASVALFIEKTIFFIINQSSLTYQFNRYIMFIIISVLSIMMAIYRFLQIKAILKFEQNKKEIINEFSKSISKKRGN